MDPRAPQPTPSSPPPLPTYSKLPLITGALLLISLAAGGAYYFGYDHGFEKSAKQEIATPSPTSVVQTDKTANWKTYVNTTYNFSIDYPQDWTLVPYATPDIIPGLKPINDKKYSQPYYAALGIREGCASPAVTNMPFEEWVKTNAQEEVQGLSDVNSMEKVQTKSGIPVLMIVWSIAPDSPSPDKISRVAYVQLPKPINTHHCVEFEFGDSSYFSTMDQILSTFKFTQ